MRNLTLENRLGWATSQTGSEDELPHSSQNRLEWAPTWHRPGQGLFLPSVSAITEVPILRQGQAEGWGNQRFAVRWNFPTQAKTGLEWGTELAPTWTRIVPAVGIGDRGKSPSSAKGGRKDGAASVLQ